MVCRNLSAFADAPRAGGAEAKVSIKIVDRALERCTPCRRRRGKALPQAALRQRQGCTPCRRRRGKDDYPMRGVAAHRMHPVQAAPRQSKTRQITRNQICRCTPCRRRRGKENSSSQRRVALPMHPVQAAPRQSSVGTGPTISVTDAPRAGGAEAKLRSVREARIEKRCTPCRRRRGKVRPSIRVLELGQMHPVQAAPRQRSAIRLKHTRSWDAPRAGSAEARHGLHDDCRCTPCRQC